MKAESSPLAGFVRHSSIVGTGRQSSQLSQQTYSNTGTPYSEKALIKCIPPPKPTFMYKKAKIAFYRHSLDGASIIHNGSYATYYNKNPKSQNTAIMSNINPPPKVEKILPQQ